MLLGGESTNLNLVQSANPKRLNELEPETKANLGAPKKYATQEFKPKSINERNPLTPTPTQQ